MTELTPEKLQELYHENDLSQKQIAERFDLSQPCISRKMKRWKIESDYNGSWSQNEVDKIKKYYPEQKEKLKSEIDRSWNAIKLKAVDLDLARDQEEHRKSEEVADHLRDLARENQVSVEFEKASELSYVLGVLDGDAYHDNKGSLGLEVKSKDFADKFADSLEAIGLNPSQGNRRGKITVWASSKIFVEWLMDFTWKTKFEWLQDTGDAWKYIEGAYDSDGNFSNPGPRICSYDETEKRFLKRVLDSLGLETSIHSNNVYVRTVSRDRFFDNVDPVLERRRP